MKEHIDRLEKELSELKKAYSKQQKKEYEEKPHVSFKIGDWIKRGEEIGKVGWVENKTMGIIETMGYCGVDIKNKSGGFKAPCRRDEWELITGEELEYITGSHKLKITLTGEQIMDLIMRYQYINASDSHNLFMNILKKLGK